MRQRPTVQGIYKFMICTRTIRFDVIHTLAMACSSSEYHWSTQSYVEQKRQFWPKSGKHILAQYDSNTIVVYQAFNPEIAEYAVKNQVFGGDKFSFSRMSWIKTNFLWMMYRCGWASKNNQERVLAVRITKEGFEEILSKAYTAEFQKSKKIRTSDIEVRLQWDPDHSPNYGKMERRAIQMGLKGKILEQYATEWVVNIKDITDFVKEQHRILKDAGSENILTAQERVYPVLNSEVASQIEVDEFQESTDEKHSQKEIVSTMNYG